jgi:hypothetical protein
VAKETVDGIEYLTFRYQKKTVSAKIAYEVECSTDLVNWTALPDYLVDPSGLVETREARVAMSDQKFLRLRITRLP